MKQILFALFTALCGLHTTACTTFLINKNGQLIFGRNYDWMTGTGMVNTNQRGLVKTSLPTDGTSPFTWISKNGSITFNQYGKEFPTGGMNEKGLVVELMWLSESQFPRHDERPSLSVLQWIQYQLDNSNNVSDVLDSDKNIRIFSNGAPQHFLVADADGNAATIEFLHGKMTVHTGKTLPYPVLTNSTYSASLDALKKKTSDNSLQRFATACDMLQQLETAPNKPLVPYAFNMLQAVSADNFTKWRIVYDIRNQRIHFKTAAATQEKVIDLKALNFACSAPAYAFDMNSDQSGPVNSLFAPYSERINTIMLKQAFEESKSAININSQLQDAIAVTASKVHCPSK